MLTDKAERRIDLDGILSVKIIREHTKTDDNPSVSDEVHLLYRSAAIEAAENYTGRKLASNGVHIQELASPTRRRRSRARYTVRLDYPAVDGQISIYGGSLLSPIKINSAPGAMEIEVPHINEVIEGCCRPCGDVSNFGIKAMYRIGLKSCGEIPAGIVMGCLKYIAWCIANRGDELVTMKNGASVQTSGISGTNNAAWASGAIEEWRAYRK
jgi:hypothetical protein